MRMIKNFIFTVKPYYRTITNDDFSISFCLKISLFTIGTNYVFYIDPKTFGYLGSDYILQDKEIEAIKEFLQKNKLRIFFKYQEEKRIYEKES